MPMNVAWSARWRLFGALRIILYVAMRKNPEPPKRLVGRPVGRPCGVAGPGVASLGPAREKILAKPNEHQSKGTVQGRRPARGERLRFLEPERRRTGPTGVGSASLARSSRLRVFDPVSGCLCGLPGSAWAREGGGHAPLSIQLTMCSSPCQPRKTSHPCCNICYALLIVGIARVATSAQSCELCGGPRVQVASLACWHG